MTNSAPNWERQRGHRTGWCWALLIAGMLFTPGLWAEDKLELKSGITLAGKIIEITDTALTLELSVGTRKLTRKYPLSRVKAATMDGERRTFGKAIVKPTKQEPPPESKPQAPVASNLITRTADEISALINQQGRTPPDWYDKTFLDYPETLDLSWPDEKPPTWNYTRNVEHYIWDIINSNRTRYSNGIRLMHHLLEVNKERPATVVKIMNELGRMYFEFYDDYARAAFWWQNAQVTTTPRLAQTDSASRLAECYWRLGNRARALQTLNLIPISYGVIKLWGDLRETSHAIKLTADALNQGLDPSEINLLAGDALRTAERYDEAIVYYRRVLDLAPEGEHKIQIERNQRRAEGTIELIQLFDQLDFKAVTDGSYEDKSYGYAGNVHLKTTASQGALVDISITSLSDKQYFHAVEATIKKILKQQSVKGIDAVSGATVTSEAVIRATAKAMAQGTR